MEQRNMLYRYSIGITQPPWSLLTTRKILGHSPGLEREFCHRGSDAGTLLNAHPSCSRHEPVLLPTHAKTG